jgi:hypothetical protein
MPPRGTPRLAMSRIPVLAATVGLLPALLARSDATPPPPPPPAPQPTPPAGQPDDRLGPGGLRALETERAAHVEADRAKREAERQLEAVRAELLRLREAGQSDAEKALEQARRDAAETARAEERAIHEQRYAAMLRGRLEDRVALAAAGRLADPADAARYLELDAFTPDERGRFDEAAIGEAVARLLTERPYLAAAPAAPPGSFDQGPRAGGGSDVMSRAAARAQRWGVTPPPQVTTGGNTHG